MKNNRNSHKSRHTIVLFLSLVLLSFSLRAQLTIVPIGTAPGDAGASPYTGARVQALSLPFFDDFATTNTARPNTNYWLSGGGVYVNNTLAATQPSLNMATFDGLSANGGLYDNVNPFSQGNTDTLTSQPINLTGLTARDSVYLSFYWLAKGLGERPDTLDAFRVEFKNVNNVWDEVWRNDGQVEQDSIFALAFVAIRNPIYLHADFQFRFRSYGRTSGPFDTWHLDYVYLNKARSIRQPYIFDVAARKPLTSFLKQYTAMPLKQYRLNPAGNTAASITGEVKNNFNNFNQLTGTFILSDSKTNQEYFRNVQSAVTIQDLGSKEFIIPIKPIASASGVDSVSLKSKFYITTTDNAIPGVDLFRNDTITAVTQLHNFFAYDDGSAEYGIQMNQKLGRAVVRFALAAPDTVAGIRMSLIPFGKDISGQAFNIQIYRNKDGKPDPTVLAQRSVSARYPPDRNGFTEFLFATPVAVKDTFYVGWLQINEQPIVVGYDRNSQFGKDHVFFNLGNEWVRDASLSGSIMIRPVMGGLGKTPPLGVEPIAGRTNYFYPNPAQGVINWENSTFKKIDIFSVDGRLVKTIVPASGSRSASLGELGAGVYVFRATDGKQRFVQKLLIAR